MKTLLRKAILAIFLLLFCTTFVKAEVFYVDTDAYGTPVAVSKSDGTTVWESDYYPFGELYSNINNQKPNNRGLIGKEKDQETGLTYFGARYYDDALARFGSVDPIGPVDPWTSQTDYAYLTNPQRLNRYVYGMNNPYRYVDPDGREVESTFDREKGAVTTTDLDTGKTLVFQAESGSKPYGEAIEAGVYDILDHPNHNFFRLEAKDKKYGNDIHDPTSRSKFRMHKPGNTVGCIAAKDMNEWVETRDLIRNTSTTTVKVDSKSRNPFAPKDETIIKFGTLIVTD